MEKQKFYYGWLIKFILAAILLAAGILMKIYDVEVVYAATGIGIVIFSLVRVVPLMKTLKKKCSEPSTCWKSSLTRSWAES
ncbi:MAG: hypothetical protein MZU97_15660 [Bacillus subtilis]|nr:hypothetical protein [Bacillus subtilis]